MEPRALVDAHPDGILVHSRGVIRYASPPLLRLMRCRLEDLVGKPVMDFIHPEDRAEVIRRGQEARERGEPVPPADFRILRPDGTLVPVETTASVVPLDGEPAILVAVRDVSIRNRSHVEAMHLRVTRDLVRRMLHLLGERGGQTAFRRDLGRTLADEVEGATPMDYVWAFTSMGIGKLRIVEQDGKRFVLEGEDLLDVEPGAPQPSCQLALGFSEGMVERLTGQPALGNEMACQSLGHPRCRFLVMAKERPKTA